VPPRILCISNGHGEDSETSHIIRAMREMEPAVNVAAIPVVGEGHAYRRSGVPVIGPTRSLPSGGFAYLHRGMWWKDVRAGLVGLTLRQALAVRRHASGVGAVLATGDQVSQALAWLSGRPFVSFIAPLSALFDGHLEVKGLLRRALASPRCRTVFARDPATAVDLEASGVGRARFGGMPSLDWLVRSGQQLPFRTGSPVVCLLPGSRVPEAVRNLRLLLKLVERIARMAPGNGVSAVQFGAAVVPEVLAELGAAVVGTDWIPDGDVLRLTGQVGGETHVACPADAYADLLHTSTLILGMAGLAVEEAVALGKAAILVPGEGPQYTYRFAEAQRRMLGPSAQLAGRGGPATTGDLDDAASLAIRTLGDTGYLARAAEEGRRRFGGPGASRRMARAVLDVALGEVSTS
jgi:uncharacterized protein (TIGR03492 family)